ncbi:unnamed protein product, partial [Nesidiocoris tenuis]
MTATGTRRIAQIIAILLLLDSPVREKNSHHNLIFHSVHSYVPDRDFRKLDLTNKNKNR